jgi:hypothetical protein
LPRAMAMGATQTTKFSVALKRVPIEAKGSALAISSMNSLLYATVLAGARAGQRIAWAFTNVAFAVGGTIAQLLGVSKATVAATCHLPL